MKKLLTAMGMLALGATIALADAGEGSPKKRGSYGGAGMGPRIEQELGLTADQKKKIEAIRQSSYDANAAFFRELQETRRKMRDARKANDAAATAALQAVVEEQRAKLAEIRAAEKRQVNAVLTDAQRAKRDAIEADLGARRSSGKARQSKSSTESSAGTPAQPEATTQPATSTQPN